MQLFKSINLQCVVEGFLSFIPLLLGVQVIHFPDLRLSGSRPGRELLSGGSSPLGNLSVLSIIHDKLRSIS
jgi:hypothetical protein